MIAALIGGIAAYFLAPHMIGSLGAARAAKAQQQCSDAERRLRDAQDH